MNKEIYYTITSEYRSYHPDNKLVKTQFKNIGAETYYQEEFELYFTCSLDKLVTMLGWDDTECFLTCGLTADNRTLWVYQTVNGFQLFYDVLPKQLLLEVLACAD